MTRFIATLLVLCFAGTPKVSLAGEWPLDDCIFAEFGKPDQMLLHVGGTLSWRHPVSGVERQFDGDGVEYAYGDLSVVTLYSKERAAIVVIAFSKRALTDEEIGRMKKVTDREFDGSEVEVIPYQRGFGCAFIPTMRQSEETEKEANQALQTTPMTRSEI